MKKLQSRLKEIHSAKLARRRHMMIAEYLANRLQVVHGRQLSLILGSGNEQSNIQAIAHWVSLRDDCTTLPSQELKTLLDELEADLVRTLVDGLPTY